MSVNERVSISEVIKTSNTNNNRTTTENNQPGTKANGSE